DRGAPELVAPPAGGIWRRRAAGPVHRRQHRRALAIVGSWTGVVRVSRRGAGCTVVAHVARRGAVYAVHSVCFLRAKLDTMPAVFRDRVPDDGVPRAGDHDDAGSAVLLDRVLLDAIPAGAGHLHAGAL